MKSIEERMQDIREDPKKIKRLFTIIWVAAYSMLMFGAFFIIWVLIYGV